MLISMNDVQLAQARGEELRRHAAGDVFASHMNVSGGKRTMADRLTGVHVQINHWAGRLQTGFTSR